MNVHHVGVAFLLIAVATAIHADKPAAAPNDKDKLKGTWQVISREGEGEKEPAEVSKHFTLTFEGEKARFLGDDTTPGADLEYSFKLDPKKSPKEIDMKITKTPDNKGVGTVFKGIYSLDGDKLKICYSDKERPTKFATKGKEHTALMSLERNKK